MPVIFSLWKPSDGGRSFKKVEALLARHHIACVKTGEVSPWAGRYEVAVAVEDASQAEALLMTYVGDTRIQALDALSDLT